MATTHFVSEFDNREPEVLCMSNVSFRYSFDVEYDMSKTIYTMAKSQNVECGSCTMTFTNFRKTFLQSCKYTCVSHYLFDNLHCQNFVASLHLRIGQAQLIKGTG